MSASRKIFIIGLIVLTLGGSGYVAYEELKPKAPSGPILLGQPAVQVQKTKPKIPQKVRPQLPKPKAQVLPVLEMPAPAVNEEVENDQWLVAIEESVETPTISEEDILRGFYYARESEKKQGTPTVWVFIEDGENSRWSSPNVLTSSDEIEKQVLCEDTGGTYIPSCLNSESETCAYIPKSECRCAEGSAWNFKNGCLKMDEAGEPIRITAEELGQGFYEGKRSEKKLGTPENWIWSEEGHAYQWQDPTL